MGAGCGGGFALDFISFFSDNWQRSHLAAAQQTRPLCSSAHVLVRQEAFDPKMAVKIFHRRSTYGRRPIRCYPPARMQMRRHLITEPMNNKSEKTISDR